MKSTFGLDYITGPPIAAMQAAGVTFVCRYLAFVNPQTQRKLLTPDEAQALSQAGIALVSIYEWYAGRALEGEASGVADALIAASEHVVCGGPAEKPLYFAVDSDVAGPQVAAYFKGVASVIGLPRVGAYGSYRVITYLFDNHLITYGWQTYAWSGGLWDARAHIQQYQNGVSMAGASVDYDRAMQAEYGQWRRGGSVAVPTTTAGGENAVFIDNITQLEAGETEDACVAFSAANVFYSTRPGTPNHHTAEEVDQLADHWYTRFTGSISSSNGLSVEQLHTMLDAFGLSFVPIPITSNGAANDEAVRTALRAGKLVIICAAESSFFDLQIGRPPYSWNTKPFNHAIVATGLITSGPYKGNVWVRDTVAVSGGYPPSTKRPYDLGKMSYVSLTAVTPSWLKGGSDVIDISNTWVAGYFKQVSTTPTRWHCAKTNQDLQAGILLGWTQMNGAPRLPVGPETKCGTTAVYQECEAGIVLYDPDHEIDAPSGPWAPCYLLKLDSDLAKKVLSIGQAPTPDPSIDIALKVALQKAHDLAVQLVAATAVTL